MGRGRQEEGPAYDRKGERKWGEGERARDLHSYTCFIETVDSDREKREEKTKDWACGQVCVHTT